jgi:hypothetical protein
MRKFLFGTNTKKQDRLNTKELPTKVHLYQHPKRHHGGNRLLNNPIDAKFKKMIVQMIQSQLNPIEAAHENAQRQRQLSSRRRMNG